MAKKINNELERISINVPSSIVKKVKEYADSLGINYTSAYIILLNQALEQKDMLKNFPLIYSTLDKFSSLCKNEDLREIKKND